MRPAPGQSPAVSIPQRWERRGLVLARGDDGWGSMVMGDPCIVRDDEAGGWRMFLFALPPGHGQALCAADPLGGWRFAGPLDFVNPEVLPDGGAYKPFVVMNADRPGHAARIGGRYALLVVTDHRAKKIWRAWSHSLAGPWTFEPRVLVDCGSANDFDAKHVDAVSAYWFEDRDEILYFYMGYPHAAQSRASSPFGSAQGAAVERVGNGAVTKLGAVLEPAQTPGHWAAGWVGGLQLFRGREHRWIGLVNASPTSPDPRDESISKEEPPPSLGGFAFCDEVFPVRGWQWCDEPIERIDEIPAAAREAGDSTNQWRHHALVLDDGRVAVFYNAGPYFQEQLFAKVSARPGPR